MSDNDTRNLLMECNSGVQMAVFSIDEILEKTEDRKLKDILSKSKEQHEKLGDETHRLLDEYHIPVPGSNPAAKGLSWIKTNAKILLDDSDHTIAALITDGCNMGIQTLHRYINEYTDADTKVKKLVSDLIHEEEDLRESLRDYL